MSEKYIKRTKKGKGHKKKEFKKEIIKLCQPIKPVIGITLALIIIADEEKKKKDK